MFVEETKISAEQLQVVIHSLKCPNGGGVEKFLKEHGQELGTLLETYVLPQIK